MKKIIAGLFAIATITFSANAQDQNTADQKKINKERQGMHKGRDGKGAPGMEKLNLTDAQKQQIKSINEDFKVRMQTLQKNDNILVKDMKEQRKNMMEERQRKILSILTPEQKTQFELMRKQHGGREKGDLKNKTKGEDWKQKRKAEDGKVKEKIKTS